MLWQAVCGLTHQSGFISLIHILVHLSKYQRGDGDEHHQHPHAYYHPDHNLPVDLGGQLPGPHHNHQPVHAHQRDQKDGSVHVGVAQVKQRFTHGVAKDPRLLGEVDNEEDGERHEEAIGTGQVEYEDRGDRASSDACQDAPDDEEVARDTQEEDQAQDQGTQARGEVVTDDAVIFWIWDSCGR